MESWLKTVTDQINRTRDSSLRVVYIGSRSSFLDLQKGLSVANSNITGISWMIAQFPSDVMTSLSDVNVPPRTLILSLAQQNISEAYDFVWDKFNRIKNNNPNQGDVIEETLVSCLAGSTQITTALDTSLTAPVIDAVFVLLTSFQRQFKGQCRQPRTLCPAIRENFDFMSERFEYPVRYAELDSNFNVDVSDFSQARRIVNFTADGDLSLDPASVMFDIVLQDQRQHKVRGTTRTFMNKYVNARILVTSLRLKLLILCIVKMEQSF